MGTLLFNFSDREQWHTADESVPGAGDYLASDGMETWVIRREGSGPVLSKDELAFYSANPDKVGPGSRVRWWREVEEVCRQSTKSFVAECTERVPDLGRFRLVLGNVPSYSFSIKIEFNVYADEAFEPFLNSLKVGDRVLVCFSATQ